MLRRTAVIAAICLLISVVASADEFSASPPDASRNAWNIRLGAGAVVRPTFEGSDRSSLQAIPFVHITYRNTINLDYTGLSAAWRHGPLRLGAGLTFNLGRPDSRESGFFGTRGDDRLRGMGDIESALGLKAFASYRLGIVNLKTSLTKFTASGNHGVVADIGMELPYRLSDRLTVTPHTSLVWADLQHMQTFFGVTSAQAASSNFRQYNPGAGLNALKIGVDAHYRLTGRWFVSLRSDLQQLVGDAADSPVSFSDTGMTAALVLGYQF